MPSPPHTKRLLVIDQDPAARRRAETELDRAGYHVSVGPALEQATKLLAARPYDAVLLSLGSLGTPPDRQVRALKERCGTTPLLLLSDPSSVRDAVRLLRHGADDYLLQPPDPHELKARLERMLERSELDSRISFFQEEMAKRSAFGSLETHSAPMRQVQERILRVAPMRSTVLIRGESGVGKELVARAIHLNSPRRDQPIIALNCAAIPASLIESELFGHEKGSFTGAHARVRGKFEIAHRGTLFLDEIGEMTPATQVKLLRVLEERELMRIGGDQSIRVDVRVIAATNADLELLVADSRFRQDLYYRLKVVTIKIPPLRERREDTPHLIKTFLEQLAKVNAVPRKTISAGALAALVDYEWPGNVRELKNMMESLLVSVGGVEVGVDDLPAYVHRGQRVTPQEGPEPGTTLAEMERDLIRQTLERTGGNRTHSAVLLGIGVRTLQRKIRAYGLSIPSRRRRPRRPRVDTEPAAGR